MQVPIPDDEVHVDPCKGRNIEELVPNSRSHSRRLSFPVVFAHDEPDLKSNIWPLSNQRIIAPNQTSPTLSN